MPAAIPLQVEAFQTQPPVVAFAVACDQLVGQSFGFAMAHAFVGKCRQPRRKGFDLHSVHGCGVRPVPAVRVRR